MKVHHSLLFTLVLCLNACTKEPAIVPDTQYNCVKTIENTHPNSAQFDAFLEQKVTEGLPGITMLIETPQGIWTGAAGMADIPNKVVMQPCNINRVGSITKTFTATIILRLAESGMLNLSDKLSQHLASDLVDKVANSETATIAQLLDHSSGIPDYTNQIDFSIAALNDTKKLWTAREELKFIDKVPAVFDAGTQRKYSNSNYVLLGLIAESITGKSGATLFQEQIFAPLGLTSTYFYQDNRLPNSLVRGYSDEEENGVLVDRTEFSFAHSSMDGGAMSSVEDLRVFLQAAMSPDVLFSKEMIQKMTTVIPPAGEDHTISKNVKSLKRNGIALGWFNLETPYGTAYGHGGSITGYQSFMLYLPDSEITVCYLVNGNSGQMDKLEDEMRDNELIPLLFE